MRELLTSILNGDYCRIPDNLKEDIESELAKPEPEPEPINIEWPDYNYQYMDSGLDELKITDTHEAMRYGWECALECVAEALPDKLYTPPPAQQKPLSDEEISKYFFHPIPNLGTAIAFARAIEKAHGIK